MDIDYPLQTETTPRRQEMANLTNVVAQQVNSSIATNTLTRSRTYRCNSKRQFKQIVKDENWRPRNWRRSKRDDEERIESIPINMIRN